MKSADSDPNHEIPILVLEPRQEEKPTAKGKYRSANNRRSKQSKQPNVNSSEAMLTRNSNENAKMQANHARNQNREAAKVLTIKGLVSKLRRMCQNFVSEQH